MIHSIRIGKSSDCELAVSYRESINPPMNLSIPLAIGIGGFCGAIARFYISGAVIKSTGDDFSFVGTLTVNLIGCFAIGILATVSNRS